MEKRKERIDRGIKARCDDIYALMSIKELSYFLLPRFIPTFFIFIFPLLRPIVGDYWERVFFIICLMSLLAMSWELLSTVGLISLGQAFFFGFGGYISAFLNIKLHIPALLSIFSSSIIGALLCTLLIFPSCRIKGTYFAMVTLCIPLFFSKIIEATGILGGTSGLSGISPISNYYLGMYVPAIISTSTMFFLRRLLSTDFGLLIRGIKDNELSLMSSGINIYKLKFIAIFLSSLISCFSGAWMAHYYQFVGISAFSLDYSIIPIASSIVGGIGSFSGSMMGAFLICPLSEMLREIGTLRITVYSTFLILFILLFPEGIFSYLSRKYSQIERWKEI